MTSPPSVSCSSSSSSPPNHYHQYDSSSSSFSHPITVTYHWTLSCEQIKNCLYDDDVLYEYEDYLDDVKIDSPVFGVSLEDPAAAAAASSSVEEVSALEHLSSPSSIRFLLRLYPRSTEGCSDVGSLVLALAPPGSEGPPSVDELRIQLLKVSITGYGRNEERQIDGVARKSTALLAQSLGWRNTFAWKEFIRNSVNLVIFCEITYFDPYFHHLFHPRHASLTPNLISSSSSATSSVRSPLLAAVTRPLYHQQRLSEDFSGLLTSGPAHLSDVLLVAADGRQFPAHKAILAARSAVFTSMFSHGECSESAHRARVLIEDITSGEVMEALLAYIYSGDTREVGRYSVELLAAADKYDIQSLVKVCVAAMLHAIDEAHEHLEEVPRLLAAADLHNLTEVKLKAMEFINRHPKEVMATEAWAVYIRPRADLLEQLYADLAKRELVGVTRFH